MNKNEQTELQKKQQELRSKKLDELFKLEMEMGLWDRIQDRDSPGADKEAAD